MLGGRHFSHCAGLNIFRGPQITQEPSQPSGAEFSADTYAQALDVRLGYLRLATLQSEIDGCLPDGLVLT